MSRRPAVKYELSIVMPCLNEAETVGVCVEKALTFLKENNVKGEVIVANNNSIDDSADIARRAGSRVVDVKEKGYGAALHGGVISSVSKYVIIGDADDSYDFGNLMPLLEKLRSGSDFVIGDRFKGEIEKGAMPPLHKYIGNPILSGLGKLFFRTKINDFHCGLRGFTIDAYHKVDMQSKGMEYASEMIVKAVMYGMRISEVPIKLSKDGRSGKPHLRSFRDGWRHLRFLLLFSPRWLFFYPGLAMMFLGIVFSAIILFQHDINWDVHSMLYSSGLVMIGFQAVIFAIFTKTFAVHEKLLPMNRQIEDILSKLSLEKGLVTGMIFVVIGIAAFVYALLIWQDGEFFEIGVSGTMRIVITSVTLLVLGFQLIFSSFFFNLLQLNTK